MADSCITEPSQSAKRIGVGSLPVEALRPEWLPQHIRELDGLRGLAVLGVLLYHCHDKLDSTPFRWTAAWGWTGVNLFFVLSGFLITGILLDLRRKPLSAGRYFLDFYARRVLRIWPVYLLLLLSVYVVAPRFWGGQWKIDAQSIPWLYYLLFAQNLFSLSLPGSLGPTWSLAIEEQYYVAWAPLARWISPRVLTILLGCLLVISPFARAFYGGAFIHTHTLFHLDGIAAGSMIAVILRLFPLTPRQWKRIALVSMLVGLGIVLCSVAALPSGVDSGLALFFSGIVLAAVSSSGEKTFVSSVWRVGFLRFFGKISYGLYMIHILIFSLLGGFDLYMGPYGTAGALSVVSLRFVVATACAALLWYWMESKILRWKRFFQA